MCQECLRYSRLGRGYGGGQAIRAHFHPPIPAAMRLFIWERDGGNCRYCGRALLFSETSIDHVLAVTKGGTDDADNLALACWDCNSSKGNREAPDLTRLHARRKAQRDMRKYELGDLYWEKEIIWLAKPDALPYLREVNALVSSKSRKPKWGNVIAYAVLKPLSPSSHGYHYDRRTWILHDNEFKRQEFYGSGVPCEGVKPSSIVAGKPSVAGRDF